MNLDFIAGLTDADGNLSLSLQREESNRFKYTRKIIFNITNKDKELLEQVKSVLKCGRIVADREVYSFRTNTHKEAERIILLLKKRIHGSAKTEMPLWEEALNLCNTDDTKTGYSKFVHLMYGINSQGAARKLKITEWLKIFDGQEDSKYVPSIRVKGIRVKVVPSVAMNGSYVSGYCQGDGSFYLSNGKRFITGFSLTDADRSILDKIQIFLRIPGTCVRPFNPRTSINNKTCYRLQIDRFTKCKEFIAPQFTKFPLFGKQLQRFRLWKEALDMTPGKYKLASCQTRITEICELLNTLK